MSSYTGDLQCRPVCVTGTFSDDEGNTSKTVITKKGKLQNYMGRGATKILATPVIFNVSLPLSGLK